MAPLNERQRRLYAAARAKSLGYGGIALVSKICGLSRLTIAKGIRELSEPPILEGKIRNAGAGRPTLMSIDSTLIEDLHTILDGSIRGDPERLLYWTCKSTRQIAKALADYGHKISHMLVSHLLKSEGYSLLSNKKILEGNQHLDRDAQFNYINNLCKKTLQEGQPVLSVDTKKKELIGNYKNHEKKWCNNDTQEMINVYDFYNLSVPKAIPYGIYDVGRNTGFVNIGTDHDTSSFSVAFIKGWWKVKGRKIYKNIKYIVITADCSGSNGYRTKLWKIELQKLANYIGVSIIVSHFPPGTSKWNKVEHRLFSFISSNWRGEPLRDYETIVNLISHTYTEKGLKVQCRLDRRKYKPGTVISKEEMSKLKLSPSNFHGEWNYTLINQ
jgi:hypothetical protein